MPMTICSSILKIFCLTENVQSKLHGFPQEDMGNLVVRLVPGCFVEIENREFTYAPPKAIDLGDQATVSDAPVSGNEE